MNRESINNLKKKFDVISYLQENGVDYSIEGDNVSYGWVGVPCVFCSDHKNHLGINLETRRFTCWLCNETGDILKYIKELQKISFGEAISVLKTFQSDDLHIPNQRDRTPSSSVIFPPEANEIIPDGIPIPVIERFNERKFPLDFVFKYSLLYCKYGKYAHSIIIPVKDVSGNLVSWQAMNVSGYYKETIPKYRDAPIEKSTIQNKHNFYRSEYLKVAHKIIIMEGVTDVWNFGGLPGQIASFTKTLSDEQIKLLVENVNRSIPIRVLYDPDAKRNSILVSKELSPYFNDVQAILIEDTDRDPGEFTREEVISVMKM
jgi:DNA primase